jgi:hypothetical protein
MARKDTLTGVLDTITDGMDGDKITLGEVSEMLKGQGFGPMMLLPALVIILPTGAVPGVQPLCSLLIIFICAQILVGRSHPWLPKRLKKYSLPRKRCEAMLKKMRPFTRKVDGFVHKRLEFLTRNGTMPMLVALASLPLALAILFLGLIPMLPAVLALPIALFALGLSVQDGLILVLGFISLAVFAAFLPTLASAASFF